MYGRCESMRRRRIVGRGPTPLLWQRRRKTSVESILLFGDMFLEVMVLVKSWVVEE